MSWFLVADWQQPLPSFKSNPGILFVLMSTSSFSAEQLSGLEKEFYTFCLNNKDGVTDRSFREQQRNALIKPVELVASINFLVSRGLIELFRSPNGGLVYRAFQKEEVDIILSLEGDEKIVYQCIKGSGNRGIWTRDLKTRTNLHQTVITKVLRSLDNRRLIKSIKSVKNSTRKVYMLYNLEPSIEVTGGPWFSENELDLQFIEEMCKVCLRFIENKQNSNNNSNNSNNSNNRSPLASSFSFGTLDNSNNSNNNDNNNNNYNNNNYNNNNNYHLYPPSYDNFASVDEIHSFIIEKQITTASLTKEDMELLINRLVLDGMIERISVGGASGTPVYKRSSFKGAADEDRKNEIPCIRCPVKRLCSKGGIINPEECVYLENYF